MKKKFSKTPGLGARLLSQAEQQPEAIGVVYLPSHNTVAEYLTYGKLSHLARGLAHKLQIAGVIPSTPVGIVLDHSPVSLAAHIAVLAIGGVCIPLDPTINAKRLTSVIEDADVHTVMIADDKTSAITDSLCNVLDVRELCETLLETLVSVDPESAAYIIYTSGSSGRPKGVVLSHTALYESTRARQKVYQEQEGLQLTLAAPGFDAAVGSMLWALLNNDRIVVLPRSSLVDMSLIRHVIDEFGVTRLICLPTLYRQVLQVGDGQSMQSLRTVVTGGETCPSDLVGLHALHQPMTRWFNEYGLTETGVWSTVHKIDTERDNVVIPIGRPIPGTWIKIVNGQGNPVSSGQSGELLVGGVSLAEGYYQQPGLNAERFINTSHNGTQQRAMRTGDLVRQRSDGLLEFIGRSDRQIKIRGQRIEPEGIETIISEHPDIVRCAVSQRPDNEGNVLAAYLELLPFLNNEERRKVRTEHLQGWSKIDHGVRGGIETSADPTFDIGGWKSSYTGKDIPAAEMELWVDNAVARIDNLGAKRILELGCGTGLLLYRLAPDCERYVGLDVSADAIEGIRQHLPKLSHELPVEVGVSARIYWQE